MVVVTLSDGGSPVELLDDVGRPIEPVCLFLRHLAARGCSPNTVRAYAYDLRRVWLFFQVAGIEWRRFSAADAAELLLHLAGSSTAGGRSDDQADGAFSPRGHARLSRASINRILAATTSFCDWAIFTERMTPPNPMRHSRAARPMNTTERHRPFLAGIARGGEGARVLRLRPVVRLPRPLGERCVRELLEALPSLRDRALVLLMLHGGLRPGEALGLHLDDVAYRARRLSIRWRDDHPKGVRAKSRAERVVDLHDGEALRAVSAYVTTERPSDVHSPHLFLVGGGGRRRGEPLSYAGFAKAFARAAARAGVRRPHVTPHALRHTHATAMWEAGMRELTLQRRLGHASPASTRIYTRVSDQAVVAEYRRAMGLATRPEDGAFR